MGTNGAVAGSLSIEREKYPRVWRDEELVEELHGVSVPDPYRWLEDSDSAETKAFVDAQKVLADEVLAKCEGREELKDILTKLMDYPRKGIPYKRGERWFYSYNTGLQNQSVVYSCKEPDDPGEVFFDPNTLAADGTTALKAFSFSHDGKHVAVSLSDKGSDWEYTRVYKVPSEGPPEEMPDKLEYVKFSRPSWTADNLGFFYCRFDKPKTDDLGTETESAVDQKCMYHRLGTPQADDVMVFAVPDHPQWLLSMQATSSGRWLLASASDGCEPANDLWILDLDEVPRAADGSIDFAAAGDGTPADATKGVLHSKMKYIANDMVSQWSLVAAEGAILTFLTNDNASLNRVVSLDGSTAVEGALSTGSFTEVLTQHPKDLLQDATPLKGDRMVVMWMRDATDIAELRRLSDGALLATISEGVPSSMSHICTEAKRASTEFWFSRENFVEPTTIFRCETAAVSPESSVAEAEVPTLEPKLFHRTPLKVQHSPDDYVVKQVFVASKDGTKVPMFVGHRRGAALGPATPALLYGYGGFNVSLQPGFSPKWLTWMKAFDGVFALANLRGGGEYGRDWRDAGAVLCKQNVFDDMHACAQYLVTESFTSPAALCIHGGSNGGLLVSACSNQRPDLYGCVISSVPVTDMLRFHKFTIGHAWRSDFGDPDKAEHFEYLRQYSPYHNVQQPAEGQFPATMITTASHDDRVVPLHSFKQISELQHHLVKQESSTQTNPIIARIEVNAGHGAGKPTSKRIEEMADMFAFAGAACGAKLAKL